MVELFQYTDLSLFFLRMVIGAVFFYHSLPKLKNASMMAQGMGMPTAFVFLLGAVECVSAAGLVLGFYVQIASLLLSIVMLGAIYFKVRKWGIPFSAGDKTGWEFDLTLLAANVFLLINGG